MSCFRLVSRFAFSGKGQLIGESDCGISFPFWARMPSKENGLMNQNQKKRQRLKRKLLGITKDLRRSKTQDGKLS